MSSLQQPLPPLRVNASGTEGPLSMTKCPITIPSHLPPTPTLREGTGCLWLDRSHSHNHGHFHKVRCGFFFSFLFFPPVSDSIVRMINGSEAAADGSKGQPADFADAMILLPSLILLCHLNRESDVCPQKVEFKTKTEQKKLKRRNFGSNSLIQPGGIFHLHEAQRV